MHHKSSTMFSIYKNINHRQTDAKQREGGCSVRPSRISAAFAVEVLFPPRREIQIK